MSEDGPGLSAVDRRVAEMFSLVSEALAAATDALLSDEPAMGSRVVAGDEDIDRLAEALNGLIWEQIAELVPVDDKLRRLVGMLFVLPELERSADLAEHIAQRAISGVGPDMSPLSRGVVQRMSEVALEMWRDAAQSFVAGAPAGAALDEADEELDILHQRLTGEVTQAAMAPRVAAQVTLLARFYERLGDHAVNVARRLEKLPGRS